MTVIRALAAQTIGYSEHAYLIALFFNTLRAATCREARVMPPATTRCTAPQKLPMS